MHSVVPLGLSTLPTAVRRYHVSICIYRDPHYINPIPQHIILFTTMERRTTEPLAFRFLDLPMELRLMVYDEITTIARQQTIQLNDLFERGTQSVTL
jgi:hypothetical protein